jgi:heme-degrading monooxygenase HmoA
VHLPVPAIGPPGRLPESLRTVGEAAVLHARLNLITTDPALLRESISYVEDEVRPVVESQPGNLGLSLLAGPELGIAILESFWASDYALVHSEPAVAPARSEMVRRVKGTVTVERYQIPVFEREAPLRGGEGVRLTRMEVEPSGIDDAIEVFGDTAVPLLAETAGFHSALLFADPASGHLISETVWRDRQALAASGSAAAVVRAEAIAATNCVIRAVEEYIQVFSSARKP